MHYYKLYTDTPYCGTDNTELFISKEPMEMTADELAERQWDLFESYGYLIHGWGEEDPTEEETDDFLAECTVDFKEITKEEFGELAVDGFPITKCY